jgi:hypothetical protein
MRERDPGDEVSERMVEEELKRERVLVRKDGPAAMLASSTKIRSRLVR